MKTIGLIGGLSFESSLQYYKIINEELNKNLGGLHSSKCIMYSVDFHEITLLQDRGDWDKITEVITNIGQKLQAAGADFIVICTNTTHKIADEVQKHLNIPILNIIDTTAEKIKDDGLKKVGLLVTKFTMEETFYRDRLSDKHNIYVVTPDKPDREFIHEIIFKELVFGIIEESSKEKLINIINKLQLKGAEGIILGCTELPLIINPNFLNIPIFNTTMIHALSAVERALEKD